MTSTQITRESLDDLIADEFANHRTMQREAQSKQREDDLDFLEAHPPTWGSLADSWAQMPDEVRTDLVGELDLDQVTAFIAAQPQDAAL